MSSQDRDQTPSPRGEGEKNRICMGQIANAHGVRGLVKVKFFAEDPQSLQQYGPLHTDETGNKTLTLILKNPLGKYWLAEIDNITDRTQAETLRGTKLWLDRDKLPTPDEGEFYVADLVALPVEDTEGKKIGHIIAVDNFGAGDLLEIQPTMSNSFYLPFTKENVKVEKDKVIVTIPEGLN